MDSQGQIEFLRCFATLKTKSQTKFYLEFHSSCLESKWVLNSLWVSQAGLLHAFSLMALGPAFLSGEDSQMGLKAVSRGSVGGFSYCGDHSPSGP